MFRALRLWLIASRQCNGHFSKTPIKPLNSQLEQALLTWLPSSSWSDECPRQLLLRLHRRRSALDDRATKRSRFARPWELFRFAPHHRRRRHRRYIAPCVRVCACRRDRTNRRGAYASASDADSTCDNRHCSRRTATCSPCPSSCDKCGISAATQSHCIRMLRKTSTHLILQRLVPINVRIEHVEKYVQSTDRRALFHHLNPASEQLRYGNFICKDIFQVSMLKCTMKAPKMAMLTTTNLL